MTTQKIIDEIIISYEFVGESFDKEGKFIGYYYLYSKIIDIFPSQLDVLKQKIKEFNFTHLYLNYYLVGFNKKI